MQKRILIILLLPFFIFAANNAISQQFYRIKVDYSVKYKGVGGEQMLQLGQVFYDINNKVILIKSSFPQQEIIVQKGNKTHKIIDGNITQTFESPIPVYFSIFHLALSNKLENFGLDQLGYSMEEIKKEKGMVMTSWKPQQRLKQQFGNILISTKNKQLFAMIFLDTSGNIIAKHFYRKYINLNGFIFPMEIARISYWGKKQSYELTTYKNIKLNEFGSNEEYYNQNQIKIK